MGKQLKRFKARRTTTIYRHEDVIVEAPSRAEAARKIIEGDGRLADDPNQFEDESYSIQNDDIDNIEEL